MNRSRNKDGTFQRRSVGEMFEGFAVYLDAKGYKLIWLDGKDVKIHVYVWEKANGAKPAGHEIHHLDYDKGNYRLENLQLVSHSDHQRIHAGWIKTNGEWTHKPCTDCLNVYPLDNFYTRKGYTPTAKCKKCHCRQTERWSKKNPEKRKDIANAWYQRNKTGGKNNV